MQIYKSGGKRSQLGCIHISANIKHSSTNQNQILLTNNASMCFLPKFEENHFQCSKMPHWWPWRLRETVLVILGLAVVLALWNITEKMPTGITWSHTMISHLTTEAAVDVDNYTRQIATYLDGRRKGLTQEQITNDIFKVSNVCPDCPMLLEYYCVSERGQGH